MYKIVFVIHLTSSLCLMAQRDPFSFDSAHAAKCEDIPAKNENAKTEYTNKKFSVGDKFDDDWTIKSVNDQVLILQNKKGQICQVSLGFSSKKN